MKNDNMLSQQEIDALLNLDEKPVDEKDLKHLSPMETDTIGEIGNISLGSAATALSELLNQKVEITAPTVSIVERDQLSEEFPSPYVGIFVKYTEGFEGSNVLVIRTSDARVIADLMLRRDNTDPSGEIGDMELSAVQEAMNQMMGSASTSMSSIFNKKIDISPPSVDVVNFRQDERLGKFPADDHLLKVSFRMKVGAHIDSSIMQLMPVDFAKQLVSELGELGKGSESAVGEKTKEETPQAIAFEEKNTQAKNIGQPASRSAASQHLGSSLRSDENKADIQAAMFSDFEENDKFISESQNLNMLFDIPLQVTVELGRTKRTVKEILQMSPGSVIELDKLAGEPVDIYVNGKMIAKGEVVVIDENFGVRVTEITSQSDRIQKLQ